MGREKRRINAQNIFVITGGVWIYLFLVFRTADFSEGMYPLRDSMINDLFLWPVALLYLACVIYYMVRGITTRSTVYLLVTFTIYCFFCTKMVIEDGGFTILVLALTFPFPCIFLFLPIYWSGCVFDQREAKKWKLEQVSLMKEAKQLILNVYKDSNQVLDQSFFDVAEYLEKNRYGIEYQLTELFYRCQKETGVTEEVFIPLTNDTITRALRCLIRKEGEDEKTYFSRIKEQRIAQIVKIADFIHPILNAKEKGMEDKKEQIDQITKWYLPLSGRTPFNGLLYRSRTQLEKEVKRAKRRGI